MCQDEQCQEPRLNSLNIITLFMLKTGIPGKFPTEICRLFLQFVKVQVSVTSMIPRHEYFLQQSTLRLPGATPPSAVELLRRTGARGMLRVAPERLFLTRSPERVLKPVEGSSSRRSARTIVTYGRLENFPNNNVSHQSPIQIRMALSLRHIICNLCI